MFWCTADIGWVTGHTYSVYGPLSNGVTQVIYEGTPDTPDQHRHFQIIEKYGVTIYYTAPTMIRTFMKWGREIPDAHDLSSLRLLGTVGEPINPRGVALVPQGHRRRRHSDRRHLVADRNRRGDDLPAARRRRRQTGFGDDAAARHLGEDRRRRRQRARARRRPTRASTPADTWSSIKPWPSMLRGIWGDPRPLPRDVLVEVRRAGLVLRRRRRPLRRRRRDLDPGPHRRRDERVGAPHLDRRGGVGAGRPRRPSPRPRWSAPPTRPPVRRSARSSCYRPITPRRPAQKSSTSCAPRWRG